MLSTTTGASRGTGYTTTRPPKDELLTTAGHDGAQLPPELIERE
jgi:hypothetical protein